VDVSQPLRLPGDASVSYQMGTVVWKVKVGANNDGADILSGLFNKGVDGWYDSAFDPITALQFNSATVNLGDREPRRHDSGARYRCAPRARTRGHRPPAPAQSRRPLESS
jgi:hypothetical protein